MNTSTELRTIESIDLPANSYADGDGLQSIITEVRAIIDNFEHDMSTAAGRKKTASLAHKVSKTKVKLDDIGKGLVGEWKAKAAKVDASRKAMRDQLDELRDQARKPLTDWENNERWRVQAHEDNLQRIKDLALTLNFSIHDLEEALDELKETEVDESWEEFKLQAKHELQRSIDMTESSLNIARQHARTKAENERLEREAAERRQAEREEQLKREATEKAKAEAEEKARQERERIERERAEAIAREEAAKRQAEEAENARIEAEARAKLEAEEAAARAVEEERKRQQEATRKEEEEQVARESNKRRVAAINRAVANAMIELGASESVAKSIVEAVAAGKVKHISINY